MYEHIEVIRGLGAGGAEMQLYRRLRHQYLNQPDTAVRCLVANTAPKQRYFQEAISALGVQVWTSNSNNPLLGGIELIRMLARSTRKSLPIICHSPYPAAALKIAFALGQIQSPIIEIVHSSRYRRDLQIAARLTNRWAAIALPVSQGVLISPTCANFIRKRVVYGGVDLNEVNLSPPTPSEVAEWRSSLSIPGTARVVISVGSLIPIKGHIDLIRALAHDETDLYHVVILGEGSQREALHAEAGKLGLTDRVHLPGFVSSPMSWMSMADLYCHPSYWEGLPLALMEAQVVGLPIVATDVGGSREVVSSPALGAIAPVGRPGRLWRCIRAVDNQDNAEYRRAIRRAGERWAVERYTDELNQIIAQYRSWTKDGTSKRG